MNTNTINAINAINTTSGSLEPDQFEMLQRTILIGHILEGTLSGAIRKFGKVQITDKVVRENISDGAVALADDCIAKMRRQGGQVGQANQVSQASQASQVQREAA